MLWRQTLHPKGLKSWLLAGCWSLATIAPSLGPAPLARAAEPLRPPAPFRSRVSSLRPSWDALLFAQLEAGDRRQIPRMQRLPDGRIRYSYKRRHGEPPLNLAQIEALILNPPRYSLERSAIQAMLSQLRGLGVRVELQPPRRYGASGEWDPKAAVVRIAPHVAAMGSQSFALVLNHETIHVAQSCRGGGLRREPVSLGLNRPLNRQSRQLLSHPVYARAPERVLRVEREAFANQDDLSLGRSLLLTYCGASGVGA